MLIAKPFACGRNPARRCGTRHAVPHIMFVTLALLIAAGPPQNARADDREAAKKACMADYKKYCNGILPGGGRAKKCLIDNLAKLDPPCREIVGRNAGGAKAPQTK